MKFAIFLSFCFASHAAAQEGKRQTPEQISQALQSGRDVVRGFQNAHAPAFCMGVAGGNPKDRALVKQGKCNSQPDQKWILDPVKGTKQLHLRNRENRNLCLGVEGGSQALRANIMVGNCNNNRDQEWSFVRPPDKQPPDPTRVNIKNANGLCIGVEGGGIDRAQLKQTKCNGAGDQVWYIWFTGD